jgi:hypothetical protein
MNFVDLSADRVGLALAPPAHSGAGLFRVVELLLKDQAALDRQLRDEAGQRAAIPQLLTVAMTGFALYGVVATAMLNGLRAGTGFWLPGVPASFADGASCGNLTVAYCVGLIAANGICLPSFYFYVLLAGVRTSMIGVVAHALKGMAAGAVALVGILPIYVAGGLSAIVFEASPWLLAWWFAAALLLPFFAGIWGAVCLYRGFVELSDTIAPGCRQRRRCFLRRLILAWSGCYTFVTPLVIYTLWHHLARVLC